MQGKDKLEKFIIENREAIKNNRINNENNKEDNNQSHYEKL